MYNFDSTDATKAYLTHTNGFVLDLATQYDPFDEDDEWFWGTMNEGEGVRPAGKDFITIEIIDDLHSADVKFFHNYLISYGFATTVPPSN